MKTTLTVHHLGRSQSERIVWLCEELGLDYELKRYDRRKDNKLAPPEYKALHPTGTAPVITDGDLVLGESGAITEYLVQTYGNGRLTIKPGEPGYAEYLFWLHFANATLQPVVQRLWVLERGETAESNPVRQFAQDRFGLTLGLVDKRLGKVSYLGGSELTTADTLSVFSFTTMRLFRPFDLTPWPNILSYLQRIGARPAYQQAMKKADPDLSPLLGAAP